MCKKEEINEGKKLGPLGVKVACLMGDYKKHRSRLSEKRRTVLFCLLLQLPQYGNFYAAVLLPPG